MSLDILFTASTHRSVDNAVRMARSLQHIAGAVLLVLSSIDVGELEAIRAANAGCVLLRSDVDNLYHNRALGFLWALFHGVHARYLCSCDDDLEFIAESLELVRELDEAARLMPFCAATFNNGAQFYEPYGDHLRGDLHVNLAWINGDSMFVPWDLVLRHGLPDSLKDAPVTYFTEIEYQLRLRAGTGRPIVGICGRPRYTHHFREPGEITLERARRSGSGVLAAHRFWRQKYGVEGIDIGDGYRYPDLYKIVEAAGPAADRHVLFGGLGPSDWPAILQETIERPQHGGNQ